MIETIVTDICKWNKDRDNYMYSAANEWAMLAEEVQELLLAKQKNMLKYAEDNELDPYAEDSFKDMPEEDKVEFDLNCLVDEADALADTAFVAIGGLFKLTGGSTSKTIDILQAVIHANKTKGKDKENGKITKPADFVGPEAEIKEILNG